jgi:hypothetical protein
MEKYSIEIETTAGWVQYHTIMRTGEDRAQAILQELRGQFPESEFRVVRWKGEVN